MNLTEPFASIAGLASALQRAPDEMNIWLEFERALSTAFGHRLFTVLAFDMAKGRLRRVHSSRPDVNPVGGAKAVTDSDWTRHVLREGRIYVGSNKADIKAVFSEHELLASIGCDSVLNIPVRKNGVTIGTLNLLDAAGRYDAASGPAALVFAQLASAPLAEYLAHAPAGPSDDGPLEHV